MNTAQEVNTITRPQLNLGAEMRLRTALAEARCVLVEDRNALLRQLTTDGVGGRAIVDLDDLPIGDRLDVERYDDVIDIVDRALAE